MQKQVLGFTILLLVFTSCSGWLKKDQTDEDVIVSVNDKVLTATELQSVIPPNTSPDDSQKIAETFVQNWVLNQVVLNKAEDNLKNDSVFLQIENQIQDYRNSLVRFAYEKELIHQKLDTIISSEEIEQYYNTNKGNFELKDNIIKVIYLKLNKKSPKINQVQKWYKSDLEKDRKLLEDYCHQFAENYFLDENTWLLFDDLLKEIPIKTYDKEQFLKNNRFIEIADSSYLYLVNIKGFKIKDSLSPLIFEKDNISKIILNQRKLKLIQDMEKDALQEATRKNQINYSKSVKKQG